MEKFIDIIGYEGLYQVSNYGNVKSFHRGGRLLKPCLVGKIGEQYYDVNLLKDGIRKHFRINVLVAIHFIPNPHNLPVVHHIDNNKLNNHYLNLKWCTQKYNYQQAYESGLGKYFPPRKVIQLDLNGNFIKEYESMGEASRDNNIDCGNISRVCNGKQNTSGGFLWEFK